MLDTLTQPDPKLALRDDIMALVRTYHDRYHARPDFEPGSSSVPVSGRVYDASDMQALVDSALDFWLTTGRFNDAFESGLGAFLGRKHVLTVNSGSSANLVALAALTSPLLKDRRLRAGDEVITAATGFPTTVNPALLYGLVPVFVDMLVPTYNIDVDQVEAAITPRTRAIMVAHTLGNPFDAVRLADIARRHDLFLVEDCCDALGATLHGQMVGGFGDIGALSFYPAHHITTGEGGAVFTDRPLLRRIMESVRDWGRDCYCAPGADDTCGRRFDWQLGALPAGYDHKYTYSHLGYNLKLTDMQASVGLAQLGHLHGFIAARRRNFALLHAGLAHLQNQLELPEATPGSEPSWFGFPLTVGSGAGFSRDDMVRRLNAAKIGTRLLFGGNLVCQPYMAGRPFRQLGDLPQANRIMTSSFWIGVYPGLSDSAIGYMVDTIDAICRGAA